jgi:hypothetical protein
MYRLVCRICVSTTGSTLSTAKVVYTWNACIDDTAFMTHLLIVVQYGGSPPSALGNENNILTALKWYCSMVVLSLSASPS